MYRGYIKLWRCIEDNPLWFSEPFSKAQAWLDLVKEAAFKDRNIIIRGILLQVKRGQCSRSEVQLAKRWKWSRGKVQRFSRFLIQQNMIEVVQQKNCLTSLITILNYDMYQPSDTPNDTADRTADGQVMDRSRTGDGTPTKNEKKLKKLKKTTKTNIEIPFPEDFKISEEVCKWGLGKGWRPEEYLEPFFEWARSKHRTYISWDSVFKRYIREDWGKVRMNGNGKQPINDGPEYNLL